jgi:1,4-dihydroxy-2-naphthoate octaprenyltransferase
MLMLAFVSVPIIEALGDLNGWILLSLLSVPLAIPLARTLRTRRDGPALNELLADTGRLLAVFSLLLSGGLLLS